MRIAKHWLGLPLLALALNVQAASERWYKADQVAKGQPLYAQNCATCHGTQGEGAANWQQALPNGKLPPPPLNGTGHTWHHPLSALIRQVQVGGAPVGGMMPPFKDQLDVAQIKAILAYMQDKWPDKIYAAWLKRGGLPTDATVKEPALRYLQNRARGRALSEPVDTPVAGIKRVQLGDDYVYVSADGRYVFTGALVDLKTGRNLTRELVEARARKILDAVPDTDKVVFAAEGKKKAAIDVFTDTSCPYCKKLHAEVPKLQKAGISVRYLPYPRGGSKGPGYQGLKHVWCADDPVQAMNDAKSDLAMGGTTDCARGKLVDAGYLLGSKLGIQGTPSIFLPTGRRVDGYVPASRLIPMILQK